MHDKSPREEARCQICRRSFANKSSLVRHIKRCSETPRPSLRQKSCRPCAAIKARCDLSRPSCGRCGLRKVSCQYTTTVSQDERPPEETDRGNQKVDSPITAAMSEPVPICSDMSLSCYDVNVQDQAVLSISEHTGQSFLNDTDSTLCLTLGLPEETGLTSSSSITSTLDLVGSPWILPLYPSPDTIPLLTKHSMEYLFRVFRTWPCMMARDLQLPPILHLSHISGQPFPIPLANCFALAKIWYASDDEHSEIVRATTLREIQSIFKNYWTYDEETLVAGLQALTIYLIMLLFPSKTPRTLSHIDSSIFSNMQTLLYYCVSAGLVLPEERQHSRPTWDTWIMINSKRRCILTLYIIQWCYSIYHCLPSFVCEELGFMPAPAAKMLWQAHSKEHWEYLYDRWLSAWDNCGYLQGEFMMVKEGIKVDFRTEMWLEEADEFGMMFMSIVNAASREPLYYGAASIKA